MANVNVIVSATGSYIIGIDSDDDSITQVFRVNKDGGGAGKDLLVIDEGAHVTFHGTFQKGGPFVLIETGGSGDIVEFRSNTTTKAVIDEDGRGVFDSGGVNLLIVTTDPDGYRSGTQGDLVLYLDTSTTTYYLKVCTGGTAWDSVTFA